MWIGASKIYSDLTMEEQHVYLRHFLSYNFRKGEKVSRAQINLRAYNATKRWLEVVDGNETSKERQCRNRFGDFSLKNARLFGRPEFSLTLMWNL